MTLNGPACRGFRPQSPTTRPSRILTTRSHAAATSGLWVTMTQRQRPLAAEPVEERRGPRPGSRCRGCRSARRPGAARLVRQRPGDRDPLALADREPRRVLVASVRQPDLVEQPRRPASAARRGARGPRTSGPGRSPGPRASAAGGTTGRRSRSAGAGRRRGRSWRAAGPRTRPTPEVGRSSPPSRCRSVLLPQPLGPVIATDSPFAHVERDAPQGLDVAVGVDPDEVDAPEQDRRPPVVSLMAERLGRLQGRGARARDRGRRARSGRGPARARPASTAGGRSAVMKMLAIGACASALTPSEPQRRAEHDPASPSAAASPRIRARTRRPPPAQGPEDADLAGPLEDGHHHRVQDARSSPAPWRSPTSPRPST